MHIHTVFFWLWKTAGPEQIRQFENGLDLLTRDPNVLERQIGKPAATGRAVIDSSYDYGVILKFSDLASTMPTRPDRRISCSWKPVQACGARSRYMTSKIAPEGIEMRPWTVFSPVFLTGIQGQKRDLGL